MYSSVSQHDFQGESADFFSLPASADLSNIALIADTTKTACPTPKWYTDAKTKTKRQSNCNRADCPHEDCPISWARKNSSILQNEVKLHPIQFYGTLKFQKGHEVGEKEWKKGVRKVSEALRKVKDKKKWKKSNKSIKFHYTTDFTPRGTDWNLLLWTTGFRTWTTLKRHLRPIIQRYFPAKKFRLYVDPPKSQVAVIKYSCKDLKDRTGVSRPHADWLGKRKIGGCRLPSGKKKSEIWAEVRKEWYPEKHQHHLDSNSALFPANFSSEANLPDPPPMTPYESAGIAV